MPMVRPLFLLDGGGRCLGSHGYRSSRRWGLEKDLWGFFLCIFFYCFVIFTCQSIAFSCFFFLLRNASVFFFLSLKPGLVYVCSIVALWWYCSVGCLYPWSSLFEMSVIVNTNMNSSVLNLCCDYLSFIFLLDRVFIPGPNRERKARTETLINKRTRLYKQNT